MIVDCACMCVCVGGGCKLCACGGCRLCVCEVRGCLQSVLGYNGHIQACTCINCVCLVRLTYDGCIVTLASHHLRVTASSGALDSQPSTSSNPGGSSVACNVQTITDPLTSPTSTLSSPSASNRRRNPSLQNTIGKH